MNKKIAFVCAVYSEDNIATGGLKLNYKLLSALKEQGYLIDVFAKSIRLFEGKIAQNAFLIKEKGTPNKEDYDFIFSEKALAPGILTYMHDFSFIHKMQNLYSPIGRFLFKIFRPKRYLGGIKYFKEQRSRLLNTNKIVVPSKLSKKDLLVNYGISEDKIVVLPPGINITKTDEPTNENTENNFVTFGLSAGSFVRKGGYITLKAIHLVQKKCKNFKVKIIYPSDNLFVKLYVKVLGLKNYVDFLPITDNMQKFYEGIDCMLVPSLIETFGMVVIEAMTNGKPAIISSRCGACDYIKNGKNGFIFDFEKKRVENLAKQMLDYIQLSNEEKKSLSKEAIKSVEDLSWENFINKILSELLPNQTDSDNEVKNQNVEISLVEESKKTECIKLIEPNFLLRRYDIVEYGDFELIKVNNNGKVYYIPIKIEPKKALLSVDMVPLTQDVFNQLIKWIFKKYPKLNKLKRRASLYKTARNAKIHDHCEYQIVLPTTGDEYLNNLSSKIRYNYGYQQRRLTKAFGSCEFKRYEEIPQALIEKYFALKKITHHKDYHLAPQEYVKDYHITEAYELVVGDKTAAVLLNAVVDGNIYMENITYDRDFNKYSAGSILMIHMILCSIERGYKNIFLGGYSDYKKHLANREYNVYSGEIYRTAIKFWLMKIGKIILKTRRENGKKIICIFGFDIIL